MAVKATGALPGSASKHVPPAFAVQFSAFWWKKTCVPVMLCHTGQ
jgi:hypothetical protein